VPFVQDPLRGLARLLGLAERIISIELTRLRKDCLCSFSHSSGLHLAFES
jgi:hypothetical protein